MKALIRPAVSLFVVLSIATGVIYPLAVTGVAKAVFPRQAAGSLIVENGKAVGFDLAHCKGCGICAKECPQDAIVMKVDEKE